MNIISSKGEGYERQGITIDRFYLYISLCFFFSQSPQQYVKSKAKNLLK